eukprot:COSAG01_NODE_21430_length_902_cov_2.043587_1_plen_60_part_10
MANRVSGSRELTPASSVALTHRARGLGWQVAGLLSETGHTVAAALAAGLDSLCLAQAQPS